MCTVHYIGLLSRSLGSAPSLSLSGQDKNMSALSPLSQLSTETDCEKSYWVDEAIDTHETFLRRILKAEVSI